MKNPIRSLYNFLLQQAEGPYAAFVLFIVAFSESSFFPIPPDVLLLPMALAKREKSLRYALICTLGSLLGALLGYAIGAFFFASFGQWIIDTYHLGNKFEIFRTEFDKWGMWIILAKGFTPIPFKLVTIASGVAGLNFVTFVLSCAATRAMRFFLVAYLAKRYGEPIRDFIERYLTWVALGVLVFILLGFWLVLH